MNEFACEMARGRGASRRGSRLASRALSLAILAPALLLAGCTTFPMRPSSRSGDDEGGFFGWHMQAPFDTSEVKTVFVYFKSQRFRRDLQLALMEQVTKEISMRTPFRVVGKPEQADSILSGVITVDDKNMIVEAPTNLPRQLSSTISVWINWKHNPPLESERAQQPTLITDTFQFVPEIGQTTLTSFQQSSENIAKQIVDMMEKPWFNETDLQ
jgi:Lipopolysaccharide-assembly